MGTQRIKRFSFLALGLIAAMMLSGCTVPKNARIPGFAESGGQTHAELAETLAAIPGLSVTTASGSEPNAKGNTGYTFALALDEGYEIADAPALIDYLVRSAWSVRDAYQPNTTIVISLDAGPLSTDKVDIVAAAEESGWVPVGSQAHRMTPDDGGSDPQFATGFTSVDVWVENSDTREGDPRGSVANRARLGNWPGSVPPIPDSAIVVAAPKS